MRSCDVNFGIVFLDKEDSKFHELSSSRECSVHSIGCSEYWGVYGSDGDEVDTKEVESELDDLYESLLEDGCLPIYWFIEDDSDYYGKEEEVSEFLNKDISTADFKALEENVIDDGSW